MLEKKACPLEKRSHAKSVNKKLYYFICLLFFPIFPFSVIFWWAITWGLNGRLVEAVVKENGLDRRYCLKVSPGATVLICNKTQSIWHFMIDGYVVIPFSDIKTIGFYDKAIKIIMDDEYLTEYVVSVSQGTSAALSSRFYAASEFNQL